MGTDGRGVVNLLGLEEMNQAIDLTIQEVITVGPDIKLVAVPQPHKNK
jgi:diaminohydroxyphosphoribosylaminopyrimidine deaminase/5-amino-6-(5-phosphoribosylamino)uracil reductase